MKLNILLIKQKERLISILSYDYLNDIDLYQVSSESIIRSKLIFNNIYRELNKESKNFRASLLEKNLKSRDLISPIDWLVTAGAIYKSEQVK